ncbi:MAG: hypothetical protein WAW39_04275 [Prosthecobacter sp.]|uniref:hypothetical protein n=1 Tax=Prosthecobacter sp. TaxID=1965333 RepID=UPI003BAF46C5
MLKPDFAYRKARFLGEPAVTAVQPQAFLMHAKRGLLPAAMWAPEPEPAKQSQRQQGSGEAKNGHDDSCAV